MKKTVADVELSTEKLQAQEEKYRVELNTANFQMYRNRQNAGNTAVMIGIWNCE